MSSETMKILNYFFTKLSESQELVTMFLVLSFLLVPAITIDPRTTPQSVSIRIVTSNISLELQYNLIGYRIVSSLVTHIAM